MSDSSKLGVQTALSYAKKLLVHVSSEKLLRVHETF
jgi:hypothetical protein